MRGQNILIKTGEVKPGVIVPGEIRTYTGIMFNVFEPKPELINIEDIAHALSNQCRFSGHTAEFYSVAQHSVTVSFMVEKRHALAALLHDAAEAYLVDMPTPIKVVMPEYSKAEDKIMQVIAEKFGFQYPFHKAIKEADKAMLETEWCGLMADSTMKASEPKIARSIFLEHFDKYSNY